MKQTIKFKGIEFEEVNGVEYWDVDDGTKALKYWDGYEWHYFIPKDILKREKCSKCGAILKEK